MHVALDPHTLTYYEFDSPKLTLSTFILSPSSLSPLSPSLFSLSSYLTVFIPSLPPLPLFFLPSLSLLSLLTFPLFSPSLPPSSSSFSPSAATASTGQDSWRLHNRLQEHEDRQLQETRCHCNGKPSLWHEIQQGSATLASLVRLFVRVLHLVVRQ